MKPKDPAISRARQDVPAVGLPPDAVCDVHDAASGFMEAMTPFIAPTYSLSPKSVVSVISTTQGTAVAGNPLACAPSRKSLGR